MLTVSRYREGDRFLTSVQTSGGFIVPCLCLSFEKERTKIGIPPFTYGSNFAGDHACLHKNLKGRVSLMPPLASMFQVNSYYDSKERTTMSTVRTQLFQLNGKWWTDFISVGEEIPYRLDHVEYFRSDSYNPVYERRWFAGLRWRGLVYYQDWVLEEYQTTGAYRRTSWTTTCVELNPARTKYRVGSIQSSQKYNPKVFGTITWTSWTSIIASSYYTLITKNALSVDDFISAGSLWDRYEMIIGDKKESPNKLIWEQLVMSAAANTKTLDINTPMYIADFLRFKDTIISFTEPLKALCEKRVPTWEEVRKMSLSWIYGLKLTFLDSQEALKGFTRRIPVLRDGTLTVHSRGGDYELLTNHGLGSFTSYIKRDFNLKFYYNGIDEVVFENIRQMFVLDVFPTLENVWDLIPFSFVVDWFVNVGDTLATIDFNTYTSVLKIKGVIRTTKITTNIPIGALIAPSTGGIVCGSVSFVDYHRRLESQLPRPSSRLGLSNPLNHWAEGGLLFIKGK